MNKTSALLPKDAACPGTYYDHLLLFDAPYASTGISLSRVTAHEKNLRDRSIVVDAPIRLFVFAQDGAQHANIRVAPSSSGLSLFPLTSIAPSLPAQFGIRLAQVIALSSSPFALHGYVESSLSPRTRGPRVGSLRLVRPASPQTLRMSWQESREQALLIANRGERGGAFRLTLETERRNYVYEGWISGLGSAFWSPEMTIEAHEWRNQGDILVHLQIGDEVDSCGIVCIESELLSSGEYQIKQIAPHFYHTTGNDYGIGNLAF